MANKPGNGNKNAPKPATDALPAMVVEESRTVPDGDHAGVIDHIMYAKRGEEGFQYLDVFVKDAESGIVIKAGYAASRVTPETELGHLLARFGASVTVDEPVDWSVLAGGTEVLFTTVTERNKNGRFAKVVLDSLRPAE